MRPFLKTVGCVLLTSLLFSVPANAAHAQDADFHSNFTDHVDRTWIGPEYFANRLQDWRLNDGRLECIEAAPQFPIRTIHLLTRSLRPEPGTLTMSVQLGAIEPDAEATLESWAGFLIGGGNDDIDHRLTAQTHHKPAQDGGLLAIVDGNGRVAFRDFSQPTGQGGGWSISGRITPDQVPILEPAETRGDGFATPQAGTIILRLHAEPADDGYTLTLAAVEEGTGKEISMVILTGVDPARVDGSIALVSHGGSRENKLGHWFNDWEIAGTKLRTHADRTFGPVLSALYTLSDDVLKMTAQFPPLGVDDTSTARLQIHDPAPGPVPDTNEWSTVAEGRGVPLSFTVPFRVNGWDFSQDTRYRIAYDLVSQPGVTTTRYYHGTIRAEPTDADEFSVAVFTGHKVYTGGIKWNHGGVWFPHNELVAAIEHHDPDFLFFSGDQIYEGDLTPADRRTPEKNMLDYLYKWYRWCWAFSDLTRTRPTVCIPDDHDVYHGNVWGAGGRAAIARDGMTAQDAGGYKLRPDLVNAIHATQTSHLPDPVDPEPIEQGISVYFTNIEYAGVSFAVLADRQFKSSPSVMVPDGKVVNGWFQNTDFDPAADADVPGAVLLGDRQLRFLQSWASDWSRGAWMKVALSQTIFANVATLPKSARSDGVVPGLPNPPADGYPENDVRAADGDSNGWPQTGRDNAIRALRTGFALHLAGDQHLGSTIQYGVDQWGDAGYAFCTPSIANTFPRRWYPSVTPQNHIPGQPRYTGDFFDGFGNRITVLAVSNPVQAGQEPARLYNRAPGYGIIRFNRLSRDITMECWPRWVDPVQPDAMQYKGWPITINQLQNNLGEAAFFLPTLHVNGIEFPVVQVVDETTNEIVYTIRANAPVFRPHVFDGDTTYELRIGDPDTAQIQRFTGLTPTAVGDPETHLEIDFDAGD